MCQCERVFSQFGGKSRRGAVFSCQCGEIMLPDCVQGASARVQSASALFFLPVRVFSQPVRCFFKSVRCEIQAGGSFFLPVRCFSASAVKLCFPTVFRVPVRCFS